MSGKRVNRELTSAAALVGVAQFTQGTTMRSPRRSRGIAKAQVGDFLVHDDVRISQN